MKKILQKLSAGLILVPALVMGLAFAAVPAATTFAACDVNSGLDGALNPDCAAGSGQQKSGLFDQGGIVNNVINIMLFITGILCVIFIIYGGIRYTISGGASDKVKDAKNTILYAIVGLIIAILGYAIVNWVFTSLS